MQIYITGDGLEVTEALHDYVLKKFERLGSLLHETTRLAIRLKVEKLDQIAEADIYMAGHDLHAKAMSRTLYTAIDLLHDKIKQQTIKLKQKLEDKKR